MVKRLFLLLCVLSFSSHAHHQVFLETKEMKEVGDSMVVVTHDRFYDMFIWGMLYIDKSSKVFPPVSVLITVQEVSEFEASFAFSSPPEQVDKSPKLTYQFDDGESKSFDAKFNAINSARFNIEFNRSEFLAFLEDFATADKISFIVGDVEETITLSRTDEAVEEYRRILAEAYIIDLEPDSVDEEEEDSLNESDDNVPPSQEGD